MLPKGWHRALLHEVAEVRTGLAVGKANLRDPVELPYLRVANVQDGRLNLSVVKRILVERSQVARYSLHRGDILMTEGGDFDKLGRGDVWQGQINPCLHQNHVFAVRPRPDLIDSSFLAAQAASNHGRLYFLSCAKRSTNLASINSSQLKKFPVLLPPLVEQRKIARVLACWDDAIAATESLLRNFRNCKHALTQQLLTGKQRIMRLPTSPSSVVTRYGRIPEDWKFPQIGEVSEEVSQRHTGGEDYPVLSCSKYKGFVNSLEYFKKQVFSNDLSNYKVVSRGDFGFPSNHIEEGSIGYQELCDSGLVSPIYTVFRAGGSVVGGFLYKLLKTDHYRQIFSASTNSSVDRRGNLRWAEFSKIRVPLPSVEEQSMISSVIDAADAETSNLQKQLIVLRQQKRALMQQLITGKHRVKLDLAT